MPDKLFHTKGIVLRSIKYGETSIIATVFTELLGSQSYLINGVRLTGKKASGKANLFQPVALLDMVAYHNELKQLQRLKEYKWGYLYQHIFSDIKKNAVALFMIELLGKCLKQPEANPDLFHFCEDVFIHLDKADSHIAANFPLFFAIHLPVFFGFRISPPSTTLYNNADTPIYLDLLEGTFSQDEPTHINFLDTRHSLIIANLLRVQQPHELASIQLNQETRRTLLQALEKFYALHIQDFFTMKTLPVLKAILS